jgi:hypothetical protein
LTCYSAYKDPLYLMNSLFDLLGPAIPYLFEEDAAEELIF